MLSTFRKEEDFEQLRDCLEKHEITFEEVGLPKEATTEECVTLLEILKPVKASLDSRGSNQYKALLSSEILVRIVSLFRILKFKKEYLWSWIRMISSELPQYSSPLFEKSNLLRLHKKKNSWICSGEFLR